MQPGNIKTKKQQNFKPFPPPRYNDYLDKSTFERLKRENLYLEDALEKANKKIEELESKLKLFDESLLTTSESDRDAHKNIYVTSLELKNEKIQQLEKQIEELKGKHKKEIAELQNEFEKEKSMEITQIKEHNTLMSELLDERKSGWLIRRDLAIRTNPILDEPNEFGFPLDFDEGKCHNLHSNEEKSTWCHFKYYYDGDYPDGKIKECDMPWSLYEFLSGRIKENISETKLKIKKAPETPPQSLLVIKNQDEFKKHLESHDICPDSITKLDDVYNFLNENRERTFSRKRFGQFCDISPKTVTIYFNFLIECHLIFQIPGKTKYKVNIKEP